jgi:hypothetical protein
MVMMIEILKVVIVWSLTAKKQVWTLLTKKELRKRSVKERVKKER